MIIVNGKDTEIAKGTVLTKFLEDSGYKKERLAVEINGDIIPKKSYDETVLCDGDKVEIVNFVGGG